MMYFFCDIDGLEPQEAGRNFGPVIDDPENKYRVTSIHSVNDSNPKAVAVADGEVIIVPTLIWDEELETYHESENEVNLILKPSNQPIEERLPGIKYYLYKGISRSSLIEGATIASEFNNELTKSIWESQRKRNLEFDISKGFLEGTTNDDSNPPLSNSLLKEIGDALPIGFIDFSTKIYRFFFKDLEGSAEINQVSAGWHIGDFVTDGDIGFEIITDGVGQIVTFKEAQIKETIISVTPMPLVPSQAEKFSHWNEKEKVLSYLDPCAFFGSFSSTALGLFKNAVEEIYESGFEIYEDVLRGKFENKNKIYVDIRNELEYSYNYFKNYSGFDALNNCIYFEGDDSKNDPLDHESFAAADFNNFGGYNWPIFVIEPSNLAAAEITENVLLQFAFPRMDNPNPFFVVIQGQLENDKFQGIFNRRKVNSKTLHFPLNGNITERVSLLTPNYSLDDTIEPISCYIRVKFLKEISQTLPAQSTTPLQSLPPKTSIISYYDLDNLFTPFEMILPWGDLTPEDELNTQSSWIYYNENYTDVMRTSAQTFIGNSGIAKDANGEITLFTFSKQAIKNFSTQSTKTFSLVGQKRKSNEEKFISWFSRENNLKLNRIQIPILGDPATDPYIDTLANIDREELESFQKYTIDEFSFISISAEDFKTLEDIVNGITFDYLNSNPPHKPFLDGYKVHLGLEFQPVSSDPFVNRLSSDSESPDYNKLYNTYEFVLRGYAYAILPGGGTDFENIEVKEVKTGVNYYRLHRQLTLERLEAISGSENSILMKGKGYTCVSEGSTALIPFPDGKFPDNPIEIKKIICKIYIYRHDGVSPQQFYEYMDYCRANIQQVWNTTSNNGLVTLFNPDPSHDISNEPSLMKPDKNRWIRPYIVDASSVEIREASSSQFDILHQDEVLFFLQLGDGREYIQEDKRIGIFYYEPALGTGQPYFERAPNVPAHEFGHILNLNDRYSSIALVDGSGPNQKLIPQGRFEIVSGIRAVPQDLILAPSIYLPPDIDDDFTQRYNWLHNLMSTLQNVTIPGRPPRFNIEIKEEPTFKAFHYFLSPVLGEGNTEPALSEDVNWLLYDKITVFITPSQFETIISHGDINERPNEYLYLKKLLNNKFFKGSFVSHHLGIIYSDDPNGGFSEEGNFKTYQKFQENLDDGKEALYLANNNFNDYDHRMSERAKKYPGSHPAKIAPMNDITLRNQIDGYFSFGNDSYESSLDVVIGGHQEESDLLREKAKQIFEYVVGAGNTLPAPANGASPNSPIVQIWEVIKQLQADLEALGGNQYSYTFTTDEYSNLGDANEYARAVWNVVSSNNVDRNSPNPPDTRFSQLGVGLRPLGDAHFVLASQAQYKNIQKHNGIRPPQEYLIIFPVYTNREVVFNVWGILI